MKLTKEEQQLRDQVAKEMWINDSHVSIDLVFEWANTFIEKRRKQHEMDKEDDFKEFGGGNYEGTGKFTPKENGGTGDYKPHQNS